MVTTPQSIAEALDGLAATDDDIARTLAAAGYPEPRVREPGSATLLNIIVARKGLGRWSAEIYMLFALGRADTWPADDLAVHLKAGGNDLEPAARRLLPAIDAVLAALADSEGCLLARMSGSGATCFGLYAERTAAEAAQAALSSHRPDWWVAAAPLLHGPLERSWWDAPAR